ncbi:hypothetical protein HanXRQr2_Chr13g0585721 [Helianthus annuus]|uniref:Uncharacterized protein n=1 Tax=Helianthus annuus TaxID=4232 RepID=A0A9K3EHH7_HELAN|nr:hypothetical protein HanXRQr2_Chr13g0585721 [Helianthus annuus]KAJ0848997.1 hypothetical protein HanPSC8_Chr13g0563891 [Helianthus annuus]
MYTYPARQVTPESTTLQTRPHSEKLDNPTHVSGSTANDLCKLAYQREYTSRFLAYTHRKNPLRNKPLTANEAFRNHARFPFSILLHTCNRLTKRTSLTPQVHFHVANRSKTPRFRALALQI